MRIHRLSIEGIGPYAVRQELDFDLLTEAGLFLLTGPTGAGKTTVLDAIVFALYGSIPGARGGDGTRDRRARERIVSDLKNPEVKPEVELEVTVAGRHFRVRRSPEFERPKTRGTGTTTAKAAASLEERVGGEWLPRSTDFQEISRELQDVIGMSANQFSQVVLLPQGEFAGFLRASVKDRREVLERLFHVEQFKAAEDWFEERTKAAKATQSEAEEGVRRVTLQLAGALGIADHGADAPPENAGDTAVLEWIQGQKARLEAELSAATHHADQARATSELADAAWSRVEAIAEAQGSLTRREAAVRVPAGRLPGARKWVAEHEGEAVAADPAQWEAAAGRWADRAAQLGGRLDDERRLPGLGASARKADEAADAAERSAAHAAEAATRATAALGPARAAAEEGGQAEAARTAALADHEALVQRLEAARRRDALGAELAEKQAALQAAEAAHTQAVDIVAGLGDPQVLAEESAVLARQQASHAARRGELQNALRQARQEAEQLSQTQQRVVKLNEERSSAEAAVLVLTAALNEATRLHLDARAARLDGMAAELAVHLVPGEPCAVCGSTEHPAPSHSDGAELAKAREDETALTQEAARTTLASGEARLATITGQLAAAEPDGLGAALAAGQQRIGELGAELTAADAEGAALEARAELQRGALAAHNDASRATQTADRTRQESERAVSQLQRAQAQASGEAGERTTHELASQVESASKQLSALRARAERGAQARAALAALEQERDSAQQAASTQRSAAAAQREAARGFRDETTRVSAELQKLRGEYPSIEAAATAATSQSNTLYAAAQLAVQHTSAEAELAQAAHRVAELVASDRVLPGEPADITERRKTRATARAAASLQAQSAGTQVDDAARRLAAVNTAEAALASALAELGPAVENARRIIALGATIRGGGDNTRKISLATYVLAARLEEVAAAASTHLRRMSSGRYELLHHDDLYGGGQAGLGLRVRDDWTGEERDTATLSGGEAFYASLSLALGLAEVVTSEAGGRQLETLLVDEGFGSLDPQTLDDVLGELEQLRAAGRAIGIVSHVDALAERIPSQLQVTPGRGGSTARIVIGS